MLLLSRSDIRQLYVMKDCLPDVEQVFEENAKGNVTTPIRTAIGHEKYGGTTLYMPSYVESLDYVAAKVITIFPDNHKEGLPALQSVILLTETKTGQHVAMMDATYLTVLRTGASSGVATKYLARPEAKNCAVLGCGAQAIGQVQAVMEVRALEEVVLYNRTRERAIQFSQALRELYPDWQGEIRIVDDPNQAVETADIIMCSTKATEPLFDGARLRPGAHINAIGAFQPHMREVDLTTLRRSHKIVVDTVEGAQHEAGDLIIPAERGEWDFSHIYAEIGEIVAGTRPARESADEITLYKSVGIAYLDTAVARSVYEKARKHGIGTDFCL